MPRYSDKRHQAVVATLLPPSNRSVEEVARHGAAVRTEQTLVRIGLSLGHLTTVDKVY